MKLSKSKLLVANGQESEDKEERKWKHLQVGS